MSTQIPHLLETHWIGDEEARDRDSVDGFVGDLPEELLFGCFRWEDGRKLVFFRFVFEIFVVVFIVGSGSSSNSWSGSSSYSSAPSRYYASYQGYSSSVHEPSASKPLSSEPLFSKSNVKAFFAAVVKTVVIIIALLGLVGWHLGESEKVSVLKLVRLLGTARSLQRDLDRIAQATDTSTRKDLSYILTETKLALLRNPDYCISAYLSVDVKEDSEEGESQFNCLSTQERAKLDEETLVNRNNMRWQRKMSRRATGLHNEYIVVTILVAVQGVLRLPTIVERKHVKEALEKIGSIPSSPTLAVEVLWTPQDKNVVLLEQEFLEKFPLLKPLETPQRSESRISQNHVGLLGTAWLHRSELDSLAQAANASTQEGLGNILTETMVALLRNSEYCISAYSSIEIITGQGREER
ncbi:FLUCTUATING-LIGHT-ACCLIMATION protein 1, chloroplastic-like protein [Drosera capensis]